MGVCVEKIKGSIKEVNLKNPFYLVVRCGAAGSKRGFIADIKKQMG